MNYGVEQLAAIVERFVNDGDSFALRHEAAKALETFRRYYDLPSESNGWRCPECGTKTKYQGWANWETWNTHLWLSNDQGSYELAQELVKDAGSVSRGAAALSDYFDELATEQVGNAGLLVDLLNGSLGAIDWHEVAEAFKPEDWGDSDEAPETDEDED